MAGACALLRLVELNYEADRLSEYGSSIFEQQLAEEWLISWARPNARRWWLDKSFFRQSICNLYTLTWIGKMRNLYKVIIYIIIKIGHMNHISVSLIPFLRKLFSHPQPYSRPCSPFVEPHFCFFEYLLQEIVHHPQPYNRAILSLSTAIFLLSRFFSSCQEVSQHSRPYRRTDITPHFRTLFFLPNDILLSRITSFIF